MTAFAYYNEIDDFAADWLERLMRGGHIADGCVDRRSIWEVAPDDLVGFTQHHFFAGIGGWSYALRLAGWPDDRAVWTGSCPCQPFSAAGRGLGFADERHLWPAYFHLIDQWRPDTIFGEQVDKALDWLDLVHNDLEDTGYAVGACDLGAPGIGAYHRRQRIYFVADRVENAGRERKYALLRRDETASRRLAGDSLEVGGRSASDQLADTECHSGGARRLADEPRESPGAPGSGTSTESGRCGDTRTRIVVEPSGEQVGRVGQSRENFWGACDWLPCRDGKSRPVEPGTFPLAHGVPARVGRLRGYGNAIVPQVAQAFIEAYLDTLKD